MFLFYFVLTKDNKKYEVRCLKVYFYFIQKVLNKDLPKKGKLTREDFINIDELIEVSKAIPQIISDINIDQSLALYLQKRLQDILKISNDHLFEYRLVEV